jgi:peptide/nickel transport system ATP-binding protein
VALRFDENAPVLEITDLSVSYWTRAGEIPAVIDFSLTVKKGETIGLVGESGCGKSTVALAIMQHMGRNGGIKSGSIRFKGVELTTLRQEELRQLRGSKISMIYQEPFAALNPSLTLGRQLMEVPIVHEGIGEQEARERAIRVLGDVRLPDPERVMAAYPHQISGGQQQRVVIAMALLSNPALLLLDEPTTALDVTVEAGITKLIGDISKLYGTSQIYISHNLGLIREVCDRVFVMYSGEVVEEGTINSLFTRPKHPYTHGLFGCIPLPTADKNAAPLKPIRGQLPLPHERPQGCNFGPRCDFFQAGRCDAKDIPMTAVTGGGATSDHRARCIRWSEIDFGTEVARGQAKDPLEIGDTVLEVERMQKYYEVMDRSTSTRDAARRSPSLASRAAGSRRSPRC